MGGSAFSRCAASSPLHRLSPASSLSCTVSPALSPLHRLSALSLLHLSPPFLGAFPLLCILLLFRAGCLVVCGPTPGRPQRVRVREEGSILFRPQTGGGLSSPPRRDGRTCSLRRRVANASPSHVGGHKKRADLAVRSALRFEGRPGISNPATWKPHRKFSGRWHGEAPALRRSRYPSWSSRRP